MMYYGEGDHIGGVDEAGVSDIAGPLVAACVVLPRIDLHLHDLRIFEVNDSKKIPERYRKQHAEVVWQVALGIGIGSVYPPEIDYLGKYSAIRLAMLRAIAACSTAASKKQLTPDFLLIDGELTLPTPIRHKLIRGGDAKSLCIAAASVVAKVYRDEIMIRLHEEHPEYSWIDNKGYPCENQFVGLDQSGLQIGVHRARYWPFVRSGKAAWETKEWAERRALWKRVTEQRLADTTRRRSSSALASSKSSAEPAAQSPS
jgi:ribonuclease HII